LVRGLQKGLSFIGLMPSADEKDLIKRVIGVGGDTVTCNNDALAVNGHVLHESYLFPHSHPCSSNWGSHKSIRVPDGQMFVMGDHRDDSEDSRVHGAVPVSDVIGRAFVVIWPASDWKTLPIPSAFSEAGLAVSSSGGTLLIIAVLVILVLAVGLFVVFHRRRRRKASYAAPDG
jgi:signal peptidase I